MNFIQKKIFFFQINLIQSIFIRRPTWFQCFQSKYFRDINRARSVWMVLHNQPWVRLQQTYFEHPTMIVDDHMAIAFGICCFWFTCLWLFSSIWNIFMQNYLLEWYSKFWTKLLCVWCHLEQFWCMHRRCVQTRTVSNWRILLFETQIGAVKANGARCIQFHIW